MRAHALALPSFEIAVSGRDDALLRASAIAIAAGAHRASALAPEEARILENAVEAFVSPLRASRSSSPQPPCAVTPGAACLPLMMSAAARRSEIRALVQEPMNTRSTFTPAIGAPGSSPM